MPNADAYQLVTYCKRLGLEVGHLIYAAGDVSPEPFEITAADVTLHVHKIDLGQPVEVIEQDVLALWAELASPLVQALPVGGLESVSVG